MRRLVDIFTLYPKSEFSIHDLSKDIEAQLYFLAWSDYSTFNRNIKFTVMEMALIEIFTLCE